MATSGTGCSTITAAAPRAAAVATNSCPSTCWPGTATKRLAGGHVARVLGHAADRDPGQRRRPDRPAVAAGAPDEAVGREPLDQARRAGRAPTARRRAGARPAFGRSSAKARPRRGPRAGRGRSRADRRPARGRRSARATARRTPACAGTARTADRPRAARRAIRRRRRRRGPSRHNPRGWPAGSPASEAGGARPDGPPARSRGRRSGPWTAGHRAGRRSARRGARPRLRRRTRRPRLEVDEMAGGQGGQPPGDEGRSRPEREVTTLAGLEEEAVEAVEGHRPAPRPGSTKPSPAPSAPIRASWRTTTSPSRSAPRIRWRVDLAIASKTAVSSAGPSPVPVAARSGSVTRCRDGWISSIGRNPAARMAARKARVAGGHLRDRPPPRPRRHAPGSRSRRSDARRDPPASLRCRRHGSARDVRAAPGNPPPAARQGQHPAAVVGHEEARRPARRPPVLGPRHRLVDVAAGCLDRRRVPAGQLVGARVPGVQSAGP